ncbi:MAG: EFR1 family ferrodoxin [Methanobrevibacter sp.]|nr:EFR1 family ferrodoxin [Methanobrevibacter sp.]
MEIKAMYFSPTKTTEKVILGIGEKLSNKLECPLTKINITSSKSREKSYSFNKEDILVLGLPVYAGRIPEILEKFIANLNGNETLAIVVAVYGNRHYDDALLEMKDLLKENGLNTIAAAAFIGEHSFSDKIAANRPDEKDMQFAEMISDKISEKIQSIKDGGDIEDIDVDGNFPYKERSELPPLSQETNDDCIRCMDCVENCPTDAIDDENPAKIDQNQCIICCSCIKICPVNAKNITNEKVLGLKAMLEENFMNRREPELFI